MKKITTFIIAAALLAALTIPAFAAAAPGGQTSADSGFAGSTLTKEERQQLAAQLRVVRQNHLEIKETSATNAQLRISLRTRIKELKESGESLPDETAAQLKKLQAQLQALRTEAGETLGDVRALSLAFRSCRLNDDFDGMTENLDTIVSTQASRIDVMGQMNTVLDEMNTLLSGN
ncbi:hypothetical protein SDC9_64755 [bioreactor metagenome]|uniref:Uncharacterized protein n=1 Tax=bioreactor metagenome TaxID=1076179 RepID=A0A644XQ69_9ZZZZ